MFLKQMSYNLFCLLHLNAPQIHQQPKQPVGSMLAKAYCRQAANRYDAGSWLIYSNFAGIFDIYST